MNKLTKEINNNLIKSGFNTQDKPDDYTKTPCFIMSPVTGNVVIISVFSVWPVIDSLLKAINVDYSDFKLHAITDKQQKRVAGKQVLKTDVACEFKPVLKDYEEII